MFPLDSSKLDTFLCCLSCLFILNTWRSKECSAKSRIALYIISSNLDHGYLHKYSTFIEFPQDEAYRLVEMQQCRNSVELLHEMLN